MSFNAMTDEAVAAELGQRIAQLRLEQNLTQQQVADEMGISRVSYRKLELGEAKLVNVIAALRALGQLALAESFIPHTAFSPIELLKMKGKQRQRAAKGVATGLTTGLSSSRKTGLHSDKDW